MMDGGKNTPFRMQVMMEVAARVVKLMVTGVWHLTFEEMEEVIEMIQREIRERKRKMSEEGEEDT